MKKTKLKRILYQWKKGNRYYLSERPVNNPKNALATYSYLSRSGRWRRRKALEALGSGLVDFKVVNGKPPRS